MEQRNKHSNKYNKKGGKNKTEENNKRIGKSRPVKKGEDNNKFGRRKKFYHEKDTNSRKSYSDKEDSEDRKYSDRNKKSYSDKDNSERKSYSDRNKKSYSEKDNSERRPYSNKDKSEKRPYSDKGRFDKGRPEKRYPKAAKKKTESESDGTRLNKYIANAGICSRREADEFIKTGLVEVNGTTITEMGFKVQIGDKVKFNNSAIKQEKSIYILMNKPKDILTTVSDDRGRRTVIDILDKKVKQRVYPVGRLDRNTTGVLLLTNDGDLAKKLSHPKYNKKKIYHAELDKKMTRDDMHKTTEGVELDDGIMSFDLINYVDNAAKTSIGVEIHSGKNRIVRRMFEALGYKVKRLDRVYFAGLTKRGLNRGRWRELTEKEVLSIKHGYHD